ETNRHVEAASVYRIRQPRVQFVRVDATKRRARRRGPPRRFNRVQYAVWCGRQPETVLEEPGHRQVNVRKGQDEVDRNDLSLETSASRLAPRLPNGLAPARCRGRSYDGGRRDSEGDGLLDDRRLAGAGGPLH